LTKQPAHSCEHPYEIRPEEQTGRVRTVILGA
jgi:hypothetical protein